MTLTGKITYRGLEVNKNDIISIYNTEGLKKILRKFTIKYKSPINNYYIEKKNFIMIKNTILFPRFAVKKLLDCKILHSVTNEIKNGFDVNFEYTGEPTDNQQIIIDYIMNNIYTETNIINGNAGLTLKLTAGCGKSFIGLNVINKLNQKTLIVVPNTYLLNQWLDLLSKFFPNNTIGQYYGLKKEDGDIVVAIINSLTSDEFIFKYGKGKKKIQIVKSAKEYFEEFGLVILDESHIYCTDSFKKVYNVFQSTYMLGLSATPDDRINGCDIISHLNIGEVLDAETIEGYKKSDVSFNASVNIIKYNGPNEFTKVHINDKTGMICVPKIIQDLIDDPYRNQLILKTIFELFELKLNIFIFSERRSHLEHLYKLFNTELEGKYDDYISIPELDINSNIVLYGNSSDQDIETAKEKSNLIFTTFAYSSTGVSINRMTAMILCTPRRSKAVQIIGRIFRLNEENNHVERLIVDIVDNKSVLKNQLYNRMKAYKERECVITKEEINYSDLEI